MEIDIYLLVCRKGGVAHRVTLKGLQGPKPLFIKTETRNLAVHHIVDVAIRDKVIIVLDPHFVCQADGQMLRLLFRKPLVGLNIMMRACACLLFSDSIRLALSANVWDLFVDFQKGLSSIVGILAEKDTVSVGEFRATNRLEITESELREFLRDVCGYFPARRLGPGKLQFSADP